MTKRVILAVAALFSLAGVADAQAFNASGATFPEPVYKKWFQDYKAIHPKVEINYAANGSGAGIKDLTSGTVDFAASDRPLTGQELAAAKNPLYFPTVLGAVVIGYNLPDVKQPLKMTPDIVAGIFLLKITKWNDPKIAAANKGVTLPNQDIVVAHRTDSSGTTFVFTDYLCKISPEWKAGPGNGQAVKWPGGLGAAQNGGVAGQIKNQKGAVGYIELAFALENKGKIQMALLQNSSGNFIEASIKSVSAAGASATDFPVMITNSPVKDAYPISTFTYMLIPRKWADAGKKAAITDFLKWMLTEGQKSAPSLFYAPLPQAVVKKDQAQIATIQ